MHHKKFQLQKTLRWAAYLLAAYGILVVAGSVHRWYQDSSRAVFYDRYVVSGLYSHWTFRPPIVGHAGDFGIVDAKLNLLVIGIPETPSDGVGYLRHSDSQGAVIVWDQQHGDLSIARNANVLIVALPDGSRRMARLPDGTALKMYETMSAGRKERIPLICIAFRVAGQIETDRELSAFLEVCAKKAQVTCSE